MTRPEAWQAAQRLARSDQLAQRQLVTLPLRGPQAAFSEVQPRQPGSPSTAPEELAELISSIATVGVLQPILVEDLPDGRRRLVSGERRLRAAKWLATSEADEVRCEEIPAVVCPGPLAEEDRRVWQLVENLARDDLQPGELAAALMYERAAVLVSKLLAAGVVVPAEAAGLDDPVARFRALDRVRRDAGATQVGAPWEEVLGRLGIQISERKARQLVRAFAALPEEISAEMDAAGVALHTRLHYLQLDQGNRAAAANLWEAVKQRQQPRLLTAAVDSCLENPDVEAEEALERAEARHEAANAARRAAHNPDAPTEEAEAEAGGDGEGHAAGSSPAAGAADGLAGEQARACLATLKPLVAALETGAGVPGYDAGSLVLYASRLLDLLGQPADTVPGDRAREEVVA